MNELRAKIKGKGHIEYTRFITIDGKEITYEELESGILEALRTAKESGEFDGVSVSDVFFDEENKLNILLSNGDSYLSNSLKGEPGRDYVLTDGDKDEIAESIKSGIKAYIDESIVDFTNKIDGKLSEVNNLVTKSVNDAKTAAIDALEYSKRAKESENKAKDYLYSVNRSADDVKYYASNAISEINLTKVSAHRDIDNQKNDAINAINRKQEETLSAVESAKEDAIEEIEDAVCGEIEEIKSYRFPNATIIGEPLISDGHVSRFSNANYLIFPFIVDVRDKKFEINFCFTTSSDVTTQQNILDSAFGLALAIRNGKGVMALSSNGTSFNLGESVGTIAIQPNSTYYAKLEFDGTKYTTKLSQDAINYSEDMRVVSSGGLHPTTIYIGGSPDLFGANTAHPFKGSINLNKCSLSIAGLEIWHGMDISGLSTRANVSLNNLDEDGEARFSDLNNEIAQTKESFTELSGRVKTLEDEPKAPDLTEEVGTLANRVKSLEDEPKAPERTAQQIIEEHITATPDYGVYTVRFPKWETSHTATGEKLDDNQGLILTPATDTVKEVNTYPPAFDTIDVNAYVDDDGVRHITAIKGDKNFKDTGRVNVFVCFRTYWEKVWEEDGYEYYSRCFYPKEGYTINRLAINRDGTYNNWFLIAKYMAGNAIGEDGKPTHDLYSAKGLKCSHYMSSPTGSDELISDSISWQGQQSILKKHGVFYTGSLMAELKHFHTTSMLYFATKHSQSVMYGLANSSVQHICAEPTENTNCFVVTASQANNIDLMQCISIGDNGLTTAPDRNIGLCHNIVYDCRVTKKEVLESGNVAIYVDHAPFTTTATSWISSFHEISGYSDFILGRTGSPVSNTNGRHGMVMDGVELMMGAYETMANAIFNATSNPLERQVIYTNDATKLSSNVNIFISNADVSDELATVEKNSAWDYISEVYTDLDNGLIINTKSGLDGSNSTTGYADGQYFDAITSGQRELLSFGYLGAGASAGLRCCGGYYGVSAAYWSVAARLSINAVGGESRSEA